ncbi:MAG: NAD-dependent epimerase/dehydratase family protein, partial [Thermoanaerobaculia bacterium]
VIDDLSTGDRANVNPAAAFHEGDLRDAGTMRVVEKIRPDVISHQAAQVDLRKSVADPAGDAEINIIASIRLLQAAVSVNVKKFIFASSGGAAYGEPLTVPQGEDHPLHPMSPYGCAKVAVEYYLTAFREVHKLRTVALRYGNVYGPRQSALGEAGVIAIFADRMSRGEPIMINGDGGQTRDFVHVSDVVAANIAAIERDVTGAFNVGTGVETSINEIYRLLAAAFGIDDAPQHGPAKRGEQRRSVLRPSVLQRKPLELSEGLSFLATPAEARRRH